MLELDNMDIALLIAAVFDCCVLNQVAFVSVWIRVFDGKGLI